MRPEGNPLDLNNLPDDQYSSRDHHGKQVLENTSSASAGYNEKEGGEVDRKEEHGKVYECRFCSLKFCKSQALGGHMNRHRQEKETEKLNNARQLLLRNDHNLVAQGALHLGCCQPIAPAAYHPAGNMGDPTIPLRFPRTFPASSSQPHLYVSPSQPVSFPTHLNIPPQRPMNDYHVGHVINNNHNMNYVAGGAGGGGDQSSNYTCIGAPVGQAGFPAGRQNREENWGRSYSGEAQAQHRLDPPPPPSTMNRFQDGF